MVTLLNLDIVSFIKDNKYFQAVQPKLWSKYICWPKSFILTKLAPYLSVKYEAPNLDKTPRKGEWGVRLQADHYII